MARDINLLQETRLVTMSAKAGEDFDQLSENEAPYYIGVQLDGDNEVETPTATEKPDGYIIPRALEGEQVTVVIDGIIPVKTADDNATGLSAGDYFELTADGKARTIQVGSEAAGIARFGATANGDVISARVSDLIVHEEEE